MIVCAIVGSANNMNKLSLVGMQLSEKYKENFDVSRPFALEFTGLVELLDIIRRILSQFFR
jgi:hypothetical protein